MSAGAFRDSVGVNVHVAFHDTAYVGWPLLVSRLQSLGVVHVRDGAYGNPAPQWRQFNADYVNAVALAASHGIRFDFMVGQPGFQGGTLDQLLAALRGPLRNAAEALEAPNEFDHFVGGPNWPSVLTRYDKELYAKAKADPSLRSLPVIGPALVGANATRTLGNQQAWLDIGNVHPYTGGQSPGPDHSNSELARARVLSGPKPIWATEAGFFNAPNATLRQSVPETTAAIYLLRTFLEHFKSGISRTYAYELIDDKPDPTATDPQQHFGLLRNDYTPKPAFTALQNLLALVGPTQGNTTLQPLRLDNLGPQRPAPTRAPTTRRQLPDRALATRQHLEPRPTAPPTHHHPTNHHHPPTRHHRHHRRPHQHRHQHPPPPQPRPSTHQHRRRPPHPHHHPTTTPHRGRGPTGLDARERGPDRDRNRPRAPPLEPAAAVDPHRAEQLPRSPCVPPLTPPAAVGSARAPSDRSIAGAAVPGS